MANQTEGVSMDGASRQYLKIDELSIKTGLSVPTLRRLVRNKRIPCIQPAGKGGRLLFPSDALENFNQMPTTEVKHPPKSLPGRRPKWES